MHCDLEYIVCCGVPPTIVDSPEWKELISVLNSNYQSPSSTKLTGNLIINEAAKISEGIKEYLGKVRHLMITFDGGKIRRPNSLYTIHITVPGGRTFLYGARRWGSQETHRRIYSGRSLSNSDSEDEFDDGADWLDGDHSLPAEFKTVEKNSFVFAGSSGIDLRSPFLCELLDSSAGRASPPASAPIKKTAVKSSSQSQLEVIPPNPPNSRKNCQIQRKLRTGCHFKV